MATTIEYIVFVCEQIKGVGTIGFKKMFGEYMVYVNDKPVLSVCDNTVFVKMLPEIKEKMKRADVGYPYDGAKEHYILDIDDADFSKDVVAILERVTPVPKPKKKSIKN
ncbi:MAG: TfoX/Sxy family protein [Lachnospiraceae bacterium]|nr:TfoX/Sxy family protein [Lachnospiraceae bacterium]